MSDETPILKSSVDLNKISKEELLCVISKAKDWALMHGACMRSKASYDADSLFFAPFILTPSSFPRKEFEKAVELQPILNELMHAVAYDAEFLTSTLASTIRVDEFTRSLFEIYEKVLAEGMTQPISLGLIRSDLMLETMCLDRFNRNCSSREHKLGTYCCWKQVEINSIASGFGHLGPASKDLQSYILQELGHDDKLTDLPPNLALSGLCNAMIQCWEIMAKPQAAILFVIENITYNICDQRFHEFQIRETNPKIKVIRKTLTEIHEQGKLGPNRELIIDNLEVTVIYFRAGYEPGHYPTTNEWDARLLIERSQAIKCPSIQYHLAGTKKVQQALAKPGILKKFLSDEKQIEAIKEIFTGLYSLDKNEGGDDAVALAIKNPERYVLKPQREGGGNNVYGDDIPDALLKMSDMERSAWVLMERIFPPLSRGYMIRPGQEMPPKVVDLVSELGIFGTIIGTKDKIIQNAQVGHMLRTKLSSANEGGVAAGLGALDSPYLID